MRWPREMSTLKPGLACGSAGSGDRALLEGVWFMGEAPCRATREILSRSPNPTPKPSPRSRSQLSAGSDPAVLDSPRANHTA